MIRIRKKLIIGAFLIASIGGCGAPEKKSDHTHLWTADQNQHVWSYEPVATVKLKGAVEEEPQGFLKREMQPGESFELDGGAIVSYDGASLRVGKQVIQTENVHVERNGAVRLNAFIRASK